MGYETDLKLFIDGVWKSGEGRDAHTVLNPVNASPIAEVPYATKAMCARNNPSEKESDL